MSSKPLVMFDVDGVINANKPKPKRADNFEFVRVLGYSIYFRPEVVAYMDKLASNPDLDVRWLTTWGDQANVHLAPAIGFGHSLPVVSTDKGTDKEWADNWWKVEAIMEMILPDRERPFVWVDDLLGKNHRRRLAGFPNRKFIRTFPDLGLKEDEMERIDTFLAEFLPESR